MGVAAAVPMRDDRRAAVVMGGFLVVAVAIVIIQGLDWGRRMPAILQRRRERRRRAAGECLGCGYSLAGNLSGVCPECGTLAQLARAGLNRGRGRDSLRAR